MVYIFCTYWHISRVFTSQHSFIDMLPNNPEDFPFRKVILRVKESHKGCARMVFIC
jgi:hypothetical protein